MAYRITADCQGCQACVRSCPTQAITGEHHLVHRIDSERCIDCGTCGRVCPYHAVEDEMGEAAQRVRRSDWDQPVIDRGLCVSCGLCIIICPVSCLDLDDPGKRIPPEGFPYLQQATACLGCGFCESICPVGAISMVPRSQMN